VCEKVDFTGFFGTINLFFYLKMQKNAVGIRKHLSLFKNIFTCYNDDSPLKIILFV